MTEEKTGATGAVPAAAGASAQSGANPGAGQNEIKKNEGIGGDQQSAAVFSDSGNAAENGAESAAKTGGGNAAKDDGRNAENARRRREAERKAELSKARVDAIIEAVGENPYTGETIKDVRDVEEYLEMKKISQSGGDPLTDYHKAVKERDRREEEKRAEERKSEEWYANDREDFAARHPDVSIQTLVEDKHFRMYAEGKIGRVPLSKIYESYRELLDGFRDSADRKAAQAAANAAASPGALAETAAAGDKDFFTKEEVEKMSKSEVARNLDKIRASMQKWGL